MIVQAIKAPFPYFGGKSTAASLIWRHLGKVKNYVEPFCGSAAVLLACPYDIPIVTLNDADGFIVNAWRAIISAPDEVARWSDWPVTEIDLFARHVWLIKQRGELTRLLETDPDYYDAKIAGWWIWGACSWIGTGWCSGDGPWTVEGGEVVYLGNAGRGVNRKRPHLGDTGKGVNRKRQGTAEGGSEYLRDYMCQLKDALRGARVCCGDWQRICGPSPTTQNGLTAVFLDPPYSAEAGRDNKLYTKDDLSVAHRVREWCVANGNNPLLRIALCGYDNEHTELIKHSWFAINWSTAGGYGNQGKGDDTPGKVNRHKETIWFSPHCLNKQFAGNGRVNYEQQEIIL